MELAKLSLALELEFISNQKCLWTKETSYSNNFKPMRPLKCSESLTSQYHKFTNEFRCLDAFQMKTTNKY